MAGIKRAFLGARMGASWPAKKVGCNAKKTGGRREARTAFSLLCLFGSGALSQTTVRLQQSSKMEEEYA
jgi:hypothetical protein